MSERPALSRGEMDVARLVWDLKSATVRDVHGALPEQRPLDFTTVQTYLRRLEAKRSYLEGLGHLAARDFGQARAKFQRVIDLDGDDRADAERLKAQKQQARQDEIDRNAVEGKFGQGKRRHSLKRIMTKLSGTSETAIMMSFLVMNLKRWLATLFFSFFREQMQALRSVRFALLGVAHS